MLRRIRIGNLTSSPTTHDAIMALNLEARQNLSDLIVAITKTGDLYLDADQVKVALRNGRSLSLSDTEQFS